MRRHRSLPFASALAILFAATTLASPADAAIIATQKSSAPFPGVTLIEGTTRAPKSNFKAAVLALCNQGIRVDATAPPTGLRTVPSWANATGAKLAVNGDFYKAGPMVYGLAAGDGKTWPTARTGVGSSSRSEWYYENYGWIAVGKGWVDFTHTGAVKAQAAKLGIEDGFSPAKVTHDVPEGTLALVSGFPELVTEGTRYTCADPTASGCFPDRGDMRARHPRTAMGLTRDRRTLIWAVVDGRSTSSAGMYGTELAELMEELGAWQAFNLDGGGSSEMWVSGRGTINRPSGGASRPVANHWGVFIDENPAAHCHAAAPTPGEAGAPSTEDELGEVNSELRPDGAADATNDEGDDDAEGCAMAPRAAAPPPAFGLLAAAVAVALGLVRRRAR